MRSISFVCCCCRMSSSKTDDMDLLRLSLRRASKYFTDWRESEKVFFSLDAMLGLGMITPLQAIIAASFSTNNGMNISMTLLHPERHLASSRRVLPVAPSVLT